MGEHGLDKDTAASRREFQRRMKQARLEPGDELMRRGWKVGAEDFRDWLADKLARRGRKGERASERRETDACLAEGMVREALAKARWREIDLATRPKGHHLKVKIAQQLRTQTPMNRQWIGKRGQSLLLTLWAVGGNDWQSCRDRCAFNTLERVIM